MSEWLGLGGVNEAYALELYERYLADPASVDAATREAFERSGPPLRGQAPALRKGACPPPIFAPSSAPSTSPSRSAGTAIWRRGSIHWDPIRSAIPRCTLKRMA